jgi:hypothetical protein
VSVTRPPVISESLTTISLTPGTELSIVTLFLEYRSAITSMNTIFLQIVETYNKFASHTASGNGTYYFTVVAYNRALDPSVPVCSDGVTIDSSVPGVKEIVVKDSLITGGLVTLLYSKNRYLLILQNIKSSGKNRIAKIN